MATYNKTLSGTDYVISSGNTLSTTYGLGYFGDGSDGDATITGSYTATRELHYNNLSVTGTGSIKPNGWKIYVKGTLTIEATADINDDGNSASGLTQGAALTGLNYLGRAASAGGAGRNTSGTGNPGANGGGNHSLNVFNLAPTGGAGGGAAANVGGSAGTATQPSPNQKWNGRWFDGRWSGGAFSGGSGGGGGALAATPGNSGAGGGGAGIVWIAASTIVNNGRISANGGNGSDGTGINAAGGGGGGGGGLVCLITKSTSYGIVTANGGSGGLGVNTGVNGSAGSSGSVAIVVVS
jgi:hypothetical protein